jgi:hypothetical protein
MQQQTGSRSVVLALERTRRLQKVGQNLLCKYLQRAITLGTMPADAKEQKEAGAINKQLRRVTLPSSTPHWSNELIRQTTPWQKILCS